MGLTSISIRDPGFEPVSLGFAPLEPAEKRIQQGQFGYYTEVHPGGGVDAAAPLTGKHPCIDYAVFPKCVTDTAGLRPAFIRKISLCAAVSDLEILRVAGTRRQRMPQQRHGVARSKGGPMARIVRYHLVSTRGNRDGKQKYNDAEAADPYPEGSQGVGAYK